MLSKVYETECVKGCAALTRKRERRHHAAL